MLSTADASRPAYYLVERPAHLPTQVARDARGSESKEQKKENSRDDYDPSGPARDEAVAPRLLERSVELPLVRIDQLSLRGRQLRRSHC
jgi:hypothetical protein